MSLTSDFCRLLINTNLLPASRISNVSSQCGIHDWLCMLLSPCDSVLECIHTVHPSFTQPSHNNASEQ